MISDILFESKLIQKLIDVGMTKEDNFVIGKHFSGHTLKNMYLIKHVVNSSKLLDRVFVVSRSMTVDDYPFFSQEESKEVLEHYNTECLEKGRPHEMFVFEELLEVHEDVYSLKRKMEPICSGEGPFESVRTLIKVARTSRLSILKDTMRLESELVHFETAMFFEVTPSRDHDKEPMTETPIHSVGCVMSTSSTSPQDSPPPCIPF